MIKFLTLDEREKWHKVVRAALSGSTRREDFAVEIADYVLEQDRERAAKLTKRGRK